MCSTGSIVADSFQLMVTVIIYIVETLAVKKICEMIHTFWNIGKKPLANPGLAAYFSVRCIELRKLFDTTLDMYLRNSYCMV